MVGSDSTAKLWHPPDPVREPLYVICAIFDPIRYKSRWKLYADFQRHIRDSGAILITIESAFGEREFAIEHLAQPASLEHPGAFKSSGPANVPPSASMPSSRLDQDYIKVRIGDNSEIWLKENLQNLAAQHLPPDAKYVAFIDADIQFSRTDWVSETLHALQHYDVVQPWSVAIDMSPIHEPLQCHQSFAFNHLNGTELPAKNAGYYYPSGVSGVVHYHPGFAWAWRVSALNRVGGLLERAILGAGDNHMAWSLVGNADRSIHEKVTPQYRNMVLDWQEAAADLKRNIGYIDGTILHRWHGRKISRGYWNRWQILLNNQYDPNRDARRDSRGVLGLTGNKPQLRDDIRRYFRSRDEDSTYVPESDHKLIGPKPGWTP